MQLLLEGQQGEVDLRGHCHIVIDDYWETAPLPSKCRWLLLDACETGTMTAFVGVMGIWTGGGGGV